MEIKRLKHQKGKIGAADQVAECRKCRKKKAKTANMGKHFPTQRRKVMTIIWGICGKCANILQHNTR